MARIARKYIAKKSFIFHVLNRGNAKQIVFRQPEDYEYFCQLLRRYKNQFKFKIYHWVLIPNHFHLEIELINNKLLSKIMAGITRAYVHYHHRKYDSSGYLWQGRFKSQPIQKSNYLITCGRYIERNPLRAGMVKLPWTYEWSSCKFYVLGDKDEITDFNPYLNLTLSDKSINMQRSQYRKWIMEADNLEFRGANKRIIGDEDFSKSLLKQGSRYVTWRQGRKVK